MPIPSAATPRPASTMAAPRSNDSIDRPSCATGSAVPVAATPVSGGETSVGAGNGPEPEPVVVVAVVAVVVAGHSANGGDRDAPGDPEAGGARAAGVSNGAGDTGAGGDAAAPSPRR